MNKNARSARMTRPQRTKMLMVRLLPGELKVLERSARRANMATSAWVRVVALEQTGRSRVFTPHVSDYTADP